MKERISLGRNEKAERRKVIFSILKNHLHPDRFSPQTQDETTIAQATEVAKILTNLLSEPTNATISEAGQRLTVPIFTDDGRSVLKELIVPKSSEEFLSELQLLIEDANDPTPPEERPTLDKFKEDLAKLKDADDVLGAFVRLSELRATGDLPEQYFLPLQTELREMAKVLLHRDIGNSTTLEKLAEQSRIVSDFGDADLLDDVAQVELNAQISRAKHYLEQGPANQPNGFGRWFRRM